MTDPLYDDPVVAEIHAIRAGMLAECDGDIRQLMRRVRQRQRGSGRAIRPAPVSESAVINEWSGAGSIISPTDNQSLAR